MPRASRHGFTLLEAVLALTLTIVLLATVMSFYFTTLQARETGGLIARDALLAHSLLHRISEELRQATDLVPGDGIAFSGTHDRITILRASMPEPYAFDEHDSMREDLPPAQLDLRRVTYELVWDEELTDANGDKICHGLLRSEQKTFDPNPKFVMKQAETTAQEMAEEAEDGEKKEPGAEAIPVERELIAPEIKYIRFRFFDGAKWQDKWQSNQGGDDTGARREHALPQAVEVTVGRIPVQPEDEELNITQLKKTEEQQKAEEYYADRFTTVVYLTQADQSLLSSRKYGSKNDEELQLGGDQ